MTSEVVGVGSVGQVADCAVGVLRWRMRGNIFCWKHSFFLRLAGVILESTERCLGMGFTQPVIILIV